MAITQVATVAALRSAGKPSPAEGVRFVQNHTSIADEGGGTFEWDNASPLTDNDGTVIRPTAVNEEDPGRWIRQVDVRGAVHPEWWGVTGDGSTADYVRLKKCFESIREESHYPTKPKVVFLAKTYLIRGELLWGQYTFVLDLQKGEVLEGQGIDKTILAARTQDDGLSTHKIAVIRAGRAGGPDQDNIVIRDLTIDCGFNQSNGKRTREAMELFGQSTIVERVKAINFGVGYDSSHTGTDKPGECFPIFLQTNTEQGLLGTIRECEVTLPGTHSMEQLPAGYWWPEITALTVLGPGGDVLGIGGAIVGNRIHDIPYDTSTAGAYQPSSPHGITVAACRCTQVADNEVLNCDGAGFYCQSHYDEDVVVRANRLINVNIGVYIAIHSADAADAKHTRMRVVDNVIVVGRVAAPLTQESTKLTLAGIDLFCSSGLEELGTRLKDIAIARNYVRASSITESTTTIYPLGVQLFLNSRIFENIDVYENTLEVPDHVKDASASNFAVAYENALLFVP